MKFCKQFPSKIIFLFIGILCFSCAERENENLIAQYEGDLKNNVSDYDFVNFEWYENYTVKDSLESEIKSVSNSRDEAGREATMYLDRNDYENRDYKREGNIKKAEIQLSLMKELDTLVSKLKSQNEAIPENEDKIIRQQAIHTFKAEKNGSEEVYKILVTFDGNGNFLKKGIAIDALQFENMLEMGKSVSEGIKRIK